MKKKNISELDWGTFIFGLVALVFLILTYWLGC